MVVLLLAGAAKAAPDRMRAITATKKERRRRVIGSHHLLQYETNECRISSFELRPDEARNSRPKITYSSDSKEISREQQRETPCSTEVVPKFSVALLQTRQRFLIAPKIFSGPVARRSRQLAAATLHRYLDLRCSHFQPGTGQVTPVVDCGWQCRQGYAGCSP